MLTKAQLLADGCVLNRNMWIGDGWIWCRKCRAYQFHEAYSHSGESDCYEVCQTCGTYSGRLPLKGRSDARGSTYGDGAKPQQEAEAVTRRAIEGADAQATCSESTCNLQ